MNVFETSLGELRNWRANAAETLAGLRKWALSARLIDEQASARLAHLERRLSTERLTIAFVGEHSRGKGELINALFFAEGGARLLPSIVGRTIQCPTEILWDETKPPSIRLLPSETRDSPRALREFLDEIDTWREVPLDPRQPQSLAPACEVLLDAIDAKTPRWRYAVINIPHPLLASGLVVLDTAGYTTLAAEPELSFHRVPDAAAIVFMLSADGITGHDQALWNEHVATIAGIEATCFVALNKIDGLREGGKSEAEVLVEIDRQVRRAADTLGVAPTRIFALSARQGLTARLKGDRDALLRSRIYRLEQALARSMVHQRRIDHATAVRAEARGVINETHALLQSRLGFAEGQLEELTALQGKNQKLVELIARKAGVERGRIEQARAAFAGLRTAHHRNADELARLLDPDVARASGLRAREAVAASAFSKGIGEALDAFFSESRERLEQAIAVIREARQTMSSVGRKFTQDYKIAIVEIADFGTERFLVELARIEEHSSREFKGGSSFMLRSRKSLGTLFFDTVALKVINIFEIADRETRAWMGGFIRPLEAQINAYQEQSNSRIEGMGRIQMADSDLVARMEELKKLASDLSAQRDQLDQHQGRVAAILEIEREPSLA
ncbi:MAG: hypothetical protein H7Y14_08775 [Burkholderiales bacterium]|nr:hypothetical protein [Burkholderiales bacterium]